MFWSYHRRYQFPYKKYTSIYGIITTMTLKSSLSIFKDKFDQELKTFFVAEKKRVKSIDPLMLQIISLLEDQVLRGGKRIRPFLANIGYKLAGGNDHKKMLKASLAVELVHQFLLMHDDIADLDETRHGDDSLHIKLNKLLNKKTGFLDTHTSISLAMISADHLYGIARSTLYKSGLPDKNIIQASNWVTDYLRSTIPGWAQQFFHIHTAIDKVSERDYLKATTSVTAHYTVEGPLIFGTLLSGNNSYNKSLSTYASHTGLAFQIQDDILGMFGDPKVTGKPVGNDFREGKKTILILRAYQKADSDDKIFIKKKLGTKFTQKELTRVQNIIKNSGSLRYATSLASKEVIKAKTSLENLPPSENKELLLELADFVIAREK